MKQKFASVLLSLLMASHAYALPAVKSVPTAVQKKIDLNTASVDALSHLIKGIGKKRAHAIVSYREAHHGFHSIDELAQVRGIGKSFVTRHHDALASLLTVSAPAA